MEKYKQTAQDIVKIEKTSPNDVKINTNASITTTTPKKRHRLEITSKQVLEQTSENKINTNANIEEDISNSVDKLSTENIAVELKNKKNIPKSVDNSTKSTDQIITRKKNRLEDVTSNLALKISTMSSKEESLQNKRKKTEELVNRSSVINYPPKKKPKATEANVGADIKPTGIFMPTIDLELHLSSESIKQDSHIKEEITIEDVEPCTNTVSKISNKKPAEILPIKKIRKRRAINRTGFPTVKKKKKKSLLDVTPEFDTKINEVCDRVPQEGEKYSTFVERMEKSAPTIQDQKPIQQDNQISEIAKWDVMSECDSLPQEDRIDFLHLDIKENKPSRDTSPVTSNDTESIKTKTESSHTSQDDLDDLTLEDRMKKVSLYKKKKLRKNFGLRQSTDRILRKRFIKRSLRKDALRDTTPLNNVEREKKNRDEMLSGDEKKNRKQPRWRKKYLVAGLFSDYYKEDE